jgi:hypothetical protein
VWPVRHVTPACGPWAAAPRLVHTSHRTDQLARSSPNCLRHPGRRGRLRGPAAGGGAWQAAALPLPLPLALTNAGAGV